MSDTNQLPDFTREMFHEGLDPIVEEQLNSNGYEASELERFAAIESAITLFENLIEVEAMDVCQPVQTVATMAIGFVTHKRTLSETAQLQKFRA